jgi:hypothetical protein
MREDWAMRQTPKEILIFTLLPALSCGYMAGRLEMEGLLLTINFIGAFWELATRSLLEALGVILGLAIFGICSIALIPLIPLIYGYIIWLIALLVLFKSGLSPILEPMSNVHFWVYGILGFIEALMILRAFFGEAETAEAVKEG